MSDNKIKNFKGAGRKRLYTIQQLSEIIDSYMINEYKGNINANKLAEYAIRTMGYTNIKYYHFTQRKEIADKIDEINRERKPQFIKNDMLSLQSIEIDGFVDRYIDDKQSLKSKLRQLQMSELSMYNKMISLDSLNRELKAVIEVHEKTAKEKEEENNILRRELKETKDLNGLLRKLIKVDNHIKALKYIWGNTLIESKDLAKQYLIILRKCGVVKEKDFIDKDITSETKEKTINLRSQFSMFAESEIEKEISITDNIDDHNKLKDISVDDIDELLKDIDT